MLGQEVCSHDSYYPRKHTNMVIRFGDQIEDEGFTVNCSTFFALSSHSSY